MNPLAQALLDALDEEAVDALVDRLAGRMAGRLAAGQTRPVEDGWMDSAAAARYLGVTLSALHKLTAARQIPFAQDGPGCKCWFKRSELDRWRRGELDREWNLAAAGGAGAAISLPGRRTGGAQRAAS